MNIMKFIRSVIFSLGVLLITFIDTLKLSNITSNIIVVISSIAIIFVFYTEKSFNKILKILFISLNLLYLLIYFYYKLI